jgi:hypothetical protein
MSLTESVTESATLRWEYEGFSVKWADGPDDVPDLDLTRFDSSFYGASQDWTNTPERWERYKNDNAPLIWPASNRHGHYPRLVRCHGKPYGHSRDQGCDKTYSVLLRRVKRLHKLSLLKNAFEPDSKFRNEVLEIAQQYTPFASEPNRVGHFEDYRHDFPLKAREWALMAGIITTFFDTWQMLKDGSGLSDVQRLVCDNYVEEQKKAKLGKTPTHTGYLSRIGCFQVLKVRPKMCEKRRTG